MRSSHAVDLAGTRLAKRGARSKTVLPAEPLGLLLLPSQLEAFRFPQHARQLLDIPRVIALEPGRVPTPRFLRDAVSLRQAKRLRFPGQPRVLILYHPAQYPLARALGARYEEAELWYLRAFDGVGGGDLSELDDLAAVRATKVHVIAGTEDLAQAEEELRRRLDELDVISHRPFFPGGRISRG